MHIHSAAAARWSRDNWFILALPLLLACSLLLTRATDWESEARAIEAVTLFDWCVTVPLLYALCYRRRMPMKRLAVRVLALACLGVWTAAQLVPVGAQILLADLGWVRIAGLCVLLLVELRLLVAALRIAFSTGATAERIAEASGAPPMLAKLMLLEARFWRAVWRLFRGR